MGGNDFEDLLGEADLIRDTPCVSLIPAAAANLLSHAGSVDKSTIDLDQKTMPNFTKTEGPHVVQAENARDSMSFQACSHAANPSVIQKIESVFEEITDSLLNEQPEISITLKIRNAKFKTGQDPPSCSKRRLCFPGNTSDEAWRFSVVLRIMELIHLALRQDKVISKRDIFYQDPALFGDQKHVDRYVDDIAFTFGVTRSALNISAAAKGLLIGNLKFSRTDGTTLCAASDREGILVPDLKEILSVDMMAVEWILVIEKEATFRAIRSSQFWQSSSSRGVMITGKGYPDLASRAMLRFLSTSSAENGFASPRVLGLADFDPDGIAILSVWKHGSRALHHESESHRVPNMQRLGLCSEQLHYAACDERTAQGILPLSLRDRGKAERMLEESAAFAASEGPLLQMELQRMLMLNCKAELQLFEATPDSMTKFLNSHLSEL